MTRRYQLATVFLADGWAHDVLVSVADSGYICEIARTDARGRSARGSASTAVEHVAGFVIPGMANAHSHAFQRGMAGSAEYRRSARDSFWTWRNAMYDLANRITPADLEILATQLFIDMLKAGYTSVAEFHYLHRQPDGRMYPQGTGLWEAIAAAAHSSGIGLTFLPTLYQTSDFGAEPLRRDQARFALDTEWFIRAIDTRIATQRLTAHSLERTGAAFHSLRAVPLNTLREVTLALRHMEPRLPLHIHIAEQRQEVTACERHTGSRPVDLLVDTGLLDRHWCLVHATHVTRAELERIAASKASVCVSISTEANLGDGFFDSAGFLRADGRLCIGSDSQCTVSPAEELRWLEYQQRLRQRRRSVLAGKLEARVGTRLWRDAARDGAEAIGQPSGVIAVGMRADWLVLDDEHASLAGVAAEAAFDHVLFAGGDAALRDVMVGGRWVVKNGVHAAEAPLRPRFAQTMARLA